MYFPSMLVLAFISCSWSFRWAIISFLCCNKMKKQWAHISVCQATRENREFPFFTFKYYYCCQHQPEFQFLFLFSPLWVVSEDFSQVYGFLPPCNEDIHISSFFVCCQLTYFWHFVSVVSELFPWSHSLTHSADWAASNECNLNACWILINFMRRSPSI